ncbi:hypothetical protein ACFX13_010677 [Malus domestica]
MKIPKLSDHLKDSSRGTVRIRDESSGELRKKKSLIQWFCPSYRDETKRKKEILIKDKEKAKELYLQRQSDLENSLAYLIKKREDDPYRNVFERIVHRMTYSAIHEVPTFEP